MNAKAKIWIEPQPFWKQEVIPAECGRRKSEVKKQSKKSQVKKQSKARKHERDGRREQTWEKWKYGRIENWELRKIEKLELRIENWEKLKVGIDNWERRNLAKPTLLNCKIQSN